MTALPGMVEHKGELYFSVGGGVTELNNYRFKLPTWAWTIHGTIKGPMIDLDDNDGRTSHQLPKTWDVT